MTSPNKSDRCRTCRKNPAGRTRGVCGGCYLRHRVAMARSATTWAALERAGLTLPAKKRGRQKGTRLETGEGRRDRGK